MKQEYETSIVAITVLIGLIAGVSTKNKWLIIFGIVVLIVYLIIQANEKKKITTITPPQPRQMVNTISSFNLPKEASLNKDPTTVQLQPPFQNIDQSSLFLNPSDNIAKTDDSFDPVMDAYASTDPSRHLQGLNFQQQQGVSMVPAVGNQPLENIPYPPDVKQLNQMDGKDSVYRRIYTPNLGNAIFENTLRMGAGESGIPLDQRQFLNARLEFSQYQCQNGGFGGKKDIYSQVVSESPIIYDTM